MSAPQPPDPPSAYGPAHGIESPYGPDYGSAGFGPPPPGSAYGYPGYPYPAYPYPPPPRTNSLAIASLVSAFFFAPLGIVFGHLSLSQIRRSGEEGRGLAIAGLVIGYVVTVATILALVAGTLLFFWAARVVQESTDPGGAGIPRYHTSAPLNPGIDVLTPLTPSTQAALVTR